jgi:hypothetical protein
MMKCWLEEWIDFLFPVNGSVSDVTREKLGKSASIPDSGGADPLKSVSGKQASAPPHDWYAPLPDIPECYKAEPLVAEAERVVRSRR